MKEHRETLLQLPYDRRSLSYLLHEDKLRACGLLGKDQSTSDWSNKKYDRWELVPLPTGILPPRREVRPPPPVRQRSPQLGNEANDEASGSGSDEQGTVILSSNMWSPSLLKHKPNRLVLCEDDRNYFYVWSWVDERVHRFDSWLGKYDIMYSLNEVWNGIAVQYGTNNYRDLSRLTSTYREGTPLASSEDGGISWLPSTSSWESSSAMDSDLDAVLASGEGAQKSKHPRGSRRSGRPSKVLKRTEKTPPTPTTASIAEDPTAQVDASISATSSVLPSVTVHPVLGPPPKKPSTSKSHMLSIRPHVDEFAIDKAEPTGLYLVRTSCLGWVRALVVSTLSIGSL
ncbi:uncharacterized protein LOC133788744 [Humulus lupulus]|uniref:uncharacterized protein LOC133788744 n=1 Tax=Humulus lupulus TaxID=3486 RepID=UPI002B40778E|nr:uncharacterized protein LOC133788744 [Humulus lupulus]